MTLTPAGVASHQPDVCYLSREFLEAFGRNPPLSSLTVFLNLLVSTLQREQRTGWENGEICVHFGTVRVIGAFAWKLNSTVDSVAAKDHAKNELSNVATLYLRWGKVSFDANIFPI